MAILMKSKRVQVISKIGKCRAVPMTKDVEVPANKAMLPMKGKAVEKVEVLVKNAMPAMKGKAIEKAVEEVVVPAKKAIAKKAKVVAGKIAKATALKRKREAEPEKVEVPAEKVRVAKKPAAATVEPVETPAAAKGGATKKQDARATEEAIIAARQKELKVMAAADVKDLAKSIGFEAGAKPDMIEKILGHEAKAREALRAQEAKRQEIMKGKKSEFAGKSATELKELCENKGLKLGGSKEERVERLVNHARDSGEIDVVLADMARDVRRAELASMQSNDLKQLCEKAGVDPLVKEIMVERLLMSEERSK